MEYVAVEEVDGSNFAFECDGKAVLYYSRSRRIEQHESIRGRVAPYAAMHGYHNAVAELFRISVSERRSLGVKWALWLASWSVGSASAVSWPPISRTWPWSVRD